MTKPKTNSQQNYDSMLAYAKQMQDIRNSNAELPAVSGGNGGLNNALPFSVLRASPPPYAMPSIAPTFPIPNLPFNNVVMSPTPPPLQGSIPANTLPKEFLDPEYINRMNEFLREQEKDPAYQARKSSMESAIRARELEYEKILKQNMDQMNINRINEITAGRQAQIQAPISVGSAAQPAPQIPTQTQVAPLAASPAPQIPQIQRQSQRMPIQPMQGQSRNQFMGFGSQPIQQKRVIRPRPTQSGFGAVSPF